MKPIKSLLAVLPNTSWGDPQMEGLKQLQHLVRYLLVGASLLLLFLAIGQFLDGNWIEAIVLTSLSIFSLAVLLFFWRSLPLAQRLGQEALWLRAAAEGEDDQLAPLAADQPAPLSTEDQPADSLRLGPLWMRKKP